MAISKGEIIREISSLKLDTEEKSAMIAASASALEEECGYINALGEGSESGVQATQAMIGAIHSLRDAAAVMLSLSRACTDCIASLSK